MTQLESRSTALSRDQPVSIFPPDALVDSVRASLAGSMQAEWIKLWSLRSTWLTLLGVFAIGVPVIWAVASFSGDEVTTVESSWFYWTAVSAVMAAVVGVLIFTADAHHGVVAVMLTSQPARFVIVVGKVVTVMAIGAVFGVVSASAGILGALLAGVPWGSASDVVTGVPWAIGYTMLTALLGLGVGLLVRSTAFAIAAVVIWGYLIEGLLALVMPASAGRFLPFLAGDQMLAFGSPGITTNAAVLSRTEGALVLGAYVAAVLLAGSLSFDRRDAV